MSVIAFMVLPVVGRGLSQARTAKGLNNQHQLAQLAKVYANDNDNFLPVGDDADTDCMLLLNSQLGASSTTYTGAGKTLRPNEQFLPVFQDPNATLPGGQHHYSAHPVLMANTTNASFPLYRITSIRRPASVIMFMDGAQQQGSHSASPTAWKLDQQALISQPYYNQPDSDNDDSIDMGLNQDDKGDSGGHIRWRQLTRREYNPLDPNSATGAANVVFSDGHGETLSITTLNNPTITQRNVRADP